MPNSIQVKLKAGRYMVPVEMWREEKRICLKFGYNKPLLEEIKAFSGAKWHGYDEKNPRKIWSVPDSPRNRFQFEYLMGNNPYSKYDAPILNITSTRPLFEHQKEIAGFELQRRECIVAAEMATGKTLATIEAIERINYSNVWWIGPKWALRSVQYEFIKWKAKSFPKFFTYEAFTKQVKLGGYDLPDFIVFDEAQKLKNPQSQRSQAAKHLTDAMRETQREPFIILLSGSPAPKSPLDWWQLCEIACPGFLKEGDIFKFKSKLAILSQEQSISGANYQKILGWRDKDGICTHCGQDKESHSLTLDHVFCASVNEVKRLYERMKGLVIVKFKKDCLDLPEKHFKIIRCEPSLETKRAAVLIKATAKTTIEALIRLRELSDGFQYLQIPQGTITCPGCEGSGQWNNDVCSRCQGETVVTNYTRQIAEVQCPKDQEVINLLDEYEDVGRFVIFAGFTAAIDRCVRICKQHEWEVVRLDQGKLQYAGPSSPTDPLLYFTTPASNRVCFVSHPGSGGMGLNLQISPGCLFYSNDFNADYRIQAMERIHRPGMDYNRGATIYDLFHLETDEYVYDNLEKKKRLQDISMGEFRDVVDANV